ncbi:hypothetical protein ACO1O0_009147 [Amphichorda felina]
MCRDGQLNDFKAAFELGACSRFNPIMELKIVRPPDDYVGKSHQHMRQKENEAGRKKPFVVIDDDFLKRSAVWYVEHFATEEEVEDSEAESTGVVYKILIKPEALALAWVNYDIANAAVGEDLVNCGVDLSLVNDFEQPDVWDCGGLDMEDEEWHQDVWVTAEPGEYEESTDKKLRENYLPAPDKVARLKEGVAEEVGLVNSWSLVDDAENVELADGTTKTFPKGSVVLKFRYNPEFPRPRAQWPEGSL